MNVANVLSLTSIIANCILLASCAEPPLRSQVRDSPNMNQSTTFERCMRDYASLLTSSGGDDARLREICSKGASRTASATRTDSQTAGAEVETERVAFEAESKRRLAEIRDQGRAIERERARAEQAEFDRSAFGRATNAIMQTAEARERARVGPVGGSSGASSSAASGANWNCDVTPTGDARLFAQWKADCERNRARSQQSASQVAPSAARPTPYQTAAQAVIVASPPIALSPPRSVADAPRSNPGSTVVSTSSTGRFELSAAHEGKVTYLHPETRKPCLSQVGVKELSSTGKTEYFKFQNICDAVINVRIIDPSGQGHGSAISPGSPGRPSTYTIYCAVEDRCGEGRWEYND